MTETIAVFNKFLVKWRRFHIEKFFRFTSPSKQTEASALETDVTSPAQTRGSHFRHTKKMLIWSNYDIKSRNDKVLSHNYDLKSHNIKGKKKKND